MDDSHTTLHRRGKHIVPLALEDNLQAEHQYRLCAFFFFFSLYYHKEFLKPDFKKDLQLGTEAVSGPFGYKKGHSVYEQAYVRGT